MAERSFKKEVEKLKYIAERNPADLHVVKVTEANLTYVAIDRNGRPLEVPPLEPGTPDEIRRYEAARERRRRRLEERDAEAKRLTPPPPPVDPPVMTTTSNDARAAEAR